METSIGAKLNSSLYGTRDAARNWEEELTKFMIARGQRWVSPHRACTTSRSEASRSRYTEMI
eukprot:7339328-Heterocapsa_arctica.AAC.1